MDPSASPQKSSSTLQAEDIAAGGTGNSLGACPRRTSFAASRRSIFFFSFLRPFPLKEREKLEKKKAKQEELF